MIFGANRYKKTMNKSELRAERERLLNERGQ